MQDQGWPPPPLTGLHEVFETMYLCVLQPSADSCFLHARLVSLLKVVDSCTVRVLCLWLLHLCYARLHRGHSSEGYVPWTGVSKSARVGNDRPYTIPLLWVPWERPYYFHALAIVDFWVWGLDFPSRLTLMIEPEDSCFQWEPRF